MRKRAWKRAVRRLKARIEALEGLAKEVATLAEAFQAEAAECLSRDLELAEAIDGVAGGAGVGMRGPDRNAN